MPSTYANTEVTDRQIEIYNFCVDFFTTEDQIPTMEAIAEYFGFGSNAAYEHMKALERQGYFTRNKLGNRKFSD